MKVLLPTIHFWSSHLDPTLVLIFLGETSYQSTFGWTLNHVYSKISKGSVLVVSSCGISLVKLGPRRLGPGPRTVRPWSPIVRFEKTGHLGLRAQLFGDQPIRGPICPEPWNHEMWNEWAGYVCGLWSLTRKARSSVHQLGGLKSVQFLSTCFRLNGEFNTWNEHWAGPSAHAMGGLLYVIPGWWIRLGFSIWF